mgnify:CR=1 FL=1
MKYGMRKPSWKKSLSARTKGRATRAVKCALIPGYGKKGMGWLHPKRKLCNTVYKKTTFSYSTCSSRIHIEETMAFAMAMIA